jgi:hypothetical protein
VLENSYFFHFSAICPSVAIKFKVFTLESNYGIFYSQKPGIEEFSYCKVHNLFLQKTIYYVKY